MSKEVNIAGQIIGPDSPPFIIAEMSGNHNGDLNRAMQIVQAVAEAGAHAIKLQTYTADTMTIKAPQEEFTITDKDSLWHGRSLYELYEEAHTPWDWHEPLFKRARELGLVAFSTPFDATAVDFLLGLDVPCFKIASFENTDIHLIRKIAATGKPLIISSGMATEEELEESINAAREARANDIILLKCTSAYPAPPSAANLATIADIAKRFDVIPGLSDHTLGTEVAVAAIALGARVVEKHVTLSRADGGVDSAFSLEPHELKTLVEQTKHAQEAIGSIQYGPANETEKKSLAYRRSIYAVKDIKAGESFTSENIRCIRPGFGLPPKHLDTVLSAYAASDIPSGTAINWDLIVKK